MNPAAAPKLDGVCYAVDTQMDIDPAGAIIRLLGSWLPRPHECDILRPSRQNTHLAERCWSGRTGLPAKRNNKGGRSMLS
jgi:hypothetical protein